MNIRPMIEYVKQNLNNRSLTCTEIGVRHGANSKIIIEYLNIKKLYSVDPYVSYNDEGVYRNRMFRFMNKIYKNAKKVLEPYIKNGSCDLVIKSSKAALRLVPDNLDFVYIDGRHDYDSVYFDCCAWYIKLRPGGVLGGHDYTTNHDAVRDAVNKFCEEYNLVLFTKFPDWWIVKGE